jgi:hypothetical protein
VEEVKVDSHAHVHPERASEKRACSMYTRRGLIDSFGEEDMQLPFIYQNPNTS